MGKRQKQCPKGVLVRLTNDEQVRLTRLAKRANLSLSRFLVEPTLTGQSPTNEDRVLRERAICVGNNLNQIARQLNAQRGARSTRVIAEALKEVQGALERIEVLWQRSSR